MGKLIALDDGHGMETPGKRTPYVPELKRSVRENEFNREVVKRLAIELQRCGYEVLLTAAGDNDVPLGDRVRLANRLKADIFVSVHFNAMDGKFDGPGLDPEGFSVHYQPGSRQGAKLATYILNELKAGTKQKNRGIVAQNLYVTRETIMPAVLSENGFMDNKREALLMVQAAFMQEVAIEHAKGICAYFGDAYVPEPPAQTASGKLYKVQTGAFGAKRNAEKLQKDLEAKGFDTFIIKEGKLYKVQCGAFSQADNAQTLAAKLNKHGYQTYIAVYN